MDSKVVLITGGSSGIGKAIGQYLNTKGYKVYGSTRSLEKHADFKDFRLLELDVREAASIGKAVNQIIDLEGRIDILINNAGVGITGPVEETPREEIQKVFDTNFYGPLGVSRAVLPIMRKQGGGFIINITSLAGFMGLPFRGFYSASKGALELMTEALRMETRSFGIKIANLAPGDIATNIAAGRYHAPSKPGSPYESTYGMSLELMNEHVDQGMDPKRVAVKVHKILNTANPKVHYTIGSPMQKFSLILKKILPDKVYERLLLNHYKL
ncbi:SDR family oxidoreductase [Poritiphilus flavus]|uniref:SDR family NAD(P)-dependent oxidoreductase n=1 Tax=Poritiphilus flavus TaxID=2697053 RepID=A0A6L9EFF6_9FLAO|nr:SDR family oxidoreductase [Poritiphilus flavus]NAS13421.1 SDR family NAD(P)-dependent oxidoreductase [Poritiphilus flavus]